MLNLAGQTRLTTGPGNKADLRLIGSNLSSQLPVSLFVARFKGLNNHVLRPVSPLKTKKFPKEDVFVRLPFCLLHGWFAAVHLTARWRDISELTAVFTDIVFQLCGWAHVEVLARPPRTHPLGRGVPVSLTPPFFMMLIASSQ